MGDPRPAAAACRALPGLGQGTSGTWAQDSAQADVGPTLPTVTPQRISRAVEHAAPWLILAGSGGIADVLAALVNQPHLLVPQVAEKQFKEKFPGEHFCWEDIVHWTELVGASWGLRDPKAKTPSLSHPFSWAGLTLGETPPGHLVPPAQAEGPSLLPLPTKPPRWLCLRPLEQGTSEQDPWAGGGAAPVPRAAGWPAL